MRSRVIPAQITTVEDKIAGNFTLTQIIILLTPVLFTTLVYALMPPSMKFVWYKIGLTALFTVICIILAIRIKGKIIASWISILSRYNLRPKYYVFNKNEVYARKVIEPMQERTAEIKEINTPKSNKAFVTTSVRDILKLNHLINNKGINLSYKIGKKGGLHVAIEKVSK